AIVTIFDGESAMSDGNMLSGRGQPDDKWFGTSYSTPAAAAAAAIIRQYFTDGWYPSGRPLAADAMTPSAALIRALLIASGVPVTGSGIVSRSPSDTWPNNEQGYGRVPPGRLVRHDERRGGGDPAVRDRRRLDRPRDRIEHPGRPAALRPRRDGRRRSVVRPGAIRSPCLLRRRHGPDHRGGLLRDI